MNAWHAVWDIKLANLADSKVMYMRLAGWPWEAIRDELVAMFGAQIGEAAVWRGLIAESKREQPEVTGL